MLDEASERESSRRFEPTSQLGDLEHVRQGLLARGSHDKPCVCPRGLEQSTEGRCHGDVVAAPMQVAKHLERIGDRQQPIP